MTTLSDPFFHRPKLAEKLTSALLQAGVLNAMASGLFLAAPRRTGKSTFLREDLRPMLMAKGVIVIYADLWKNKEIDPGIVIASAIKEEMLKHKGLVARLAKAAGVDKVSVGGLSFVVDKIGTEQGASLSTALAKLSDETKKMIVLIIDEAQHAITTKGGSDALFALKAARDELNSSLHHGLRVVATGSNRDKISMLRGSKDQAFFSAPLRDFPPLGKEYIQWFCANSNVGLEPDAVLELFKQASSRPEIFNAAVSAMALDLSEDEDESAEPMTFEQLVMSEITRSNDELLRVIESLTPLQSAVIRVLALKGEKYAPFDAETMKLYTSILTKIAPEQECKVDVSSVQQALTMLQEKTLVWKAARGVYALEESALGDLLQRQGLLKVAEPEIVEVSAQVDGVGEDKPAG
jgi:hypothetical protein